MATALKAGNATTGGSFTPDGTGILEFKTGANAGTTALTLDASQNATFTNALSKIYSITASVATNALTVTLNPCSLDFRSATLTSGTVVTRTVTTAISMTVSSGSTLGTVSAQQSRIIVLAIDNAGTVELAVVNISGGTNLTETGVISTTAEGGAGAADSATVIYSTTARTNVAYRVVGYVESTQTTAGTWATAPSTIQGYGGQALAAMSSLGYGQTYQDVSGSRAFGTTYYNTTGRPITLNLRCNNGTQCNYTGVVNSINVNIIKHLASDAITAAVISLVIPPNASYSVSTSGGTPLNATWIELR